MSTTPPEPVQTPKTLKEFSRALSSHLPRRMAQLRHLGKATRALARRRTRH